MCCYMNLIKGPFESRQQATHSAHHTHKLKHTHTHAYYERAHTWVLTPINEVTHNCKGFNFNKFTLPAVSVCLSVLAAGVHKCTQVCATKRVSLSTRLESSAPVCVCVRPEKIACKSSWTATWKNDQQPSEIKRWLQCMTCQGSPRPRPQA